MESGRIEKDKETIKGSIGKEYNRFKEEIKASLLTYLPHSVRGLVMTQVQK